MSDEQLVQLREQTPAEPTALTAQLAKWIGASLLPADTPLSPAELTAAAAFMLASAQQRAPTATALAIDTVSGSARSRFMRIAVINEDMPFLVDSIAATIAAHGLEIQRLIHPVIAVARDGDGCITGVPDAADGEDTRPESFIYVETRRANARQRAALAAGLNLTLADVRAAVSDWPAMRTALGSDADRLAALGRSEGPALLHWFQDGMLTQLGVVQRRRDGHQQHMLGICRSSAGELLSPDLYARAFAWFDAALPGDRVPLILKSRTSSRVHRRVPLDLFLVPINEDGAVVALSVHAGVWTSAALAAAPDDVPRLRAQLAALMTKYGLRPEGHAGKALVHALTKLPHDLMISFSDPDLERVAMATMSLIDRPRPALALVEGELGRQLFAFVWLPRDALTSRVRAEVAAMLTEASGAKVLDWSLAVEGSNLAQLLWVLDLPEDGTIPDEAVLEARLQVMLRGWSDVVEGEIARGGEKSRAAAIAERYAEAFPLAYRNVYGPAEAAADIARLRYLDSREGQVAGRRAVRLYRFPGDKPRQLRLKIYQRSGLLTLSGAVPGLENFGFRVIDNYPFTLTRDGVAIGSIHDFLLDAPLGSDPDAILAHRAPIEAAMTAVANSLGENDPFNRLIAGVGLSATEANWLRAWYRYLRQAGMSYDIATAVDALIGAPMVTRGLIALFRARHDRGAAVAESEAEDAIRSGPRPGRQDQR